MFKDKNDFLNALQNLPGHDDHYSGLARDRQDILTKPKDSLGRLEELACWLAGWQQTEKPTAKQVTVTLFAANHGITVQNISPFPAEVTAQMVHNFRQDGAAINQIGKASDIELSVKPIKLEQPTGDISKEKAMSSEECLAALNIGAASLNAADDIVIPGEMGIGNTTIASIICAKLYGGGGQKWAGAGTGLDKEGIAHKSKVIDQALAYHRQTFSDPFTLLCHIGGREVAAICGLILAARISRIPVILDGFIVGAAAAALTVGTDNTLDHCIAGHLSNEQAHKELLKKLGLDPALLNLGMRLGEATGAALAVQIVRNAVSIHNGMASFDEAGIKQK